MSSAIGPGDWVECIDSTGDHPNHIPVVKGQLYLVERIVQIFRWDGIKSVPIPGEFGLILKGVHWEAWPGQEGSYNAENFRLINRPKPEEYWQKLSQPTPELIAEGTKKKKVNAI